jgi:hypothetical protein
VKNKKPGKFSRPFVKKILVVISFPLFVYKANEYRLFQPFLHVKKIFPPPYAWICSPEKDPGCGKHSLFSLKRYTVPNQ